MTNKSKKFISESEKVAFDLDHRKTIGFNMSKYKAAVEKGKHQYSNIDLAKETAAKIKREVINNLDKYLEQFEDNFTANGGQVFWANDAKEAATEILRLAEKYSAKIAVKSKSMTTEEAEVNNALESIGVESVETDLGEYIVQLAGEKPYHIVTPAMHKSKQDVSILFNKKFNTPNDSSPEFITNFVRQKLREKFTSAEIGITGANFLIAQAGSVAVTENEGNALMSTSFPKAHIVIVGIEKIIPALEDLDLFWSLLAASGTGQKITAYNSIFSGPRKENETDGPDEMIVILLDNGRSNLLSHEKTRDALCCIRCGACLNACPVYKNIGGYTYATTYSGPIGSVITPHLKGLEEYGHLSFASSLCGTCSEVCPVKIPLHKMLLHNRQEVVRKGFVTKTEKMIFKNWSKAMTGRHLINAMGGDTKNLGMKLFAMKHWSKKREMPSFPKKSFKKMWVAARKHKDNL